MNRLKALEAEHPELITPDSPTQRVGGKPKEGFVKTPHSRPMLSLDNAYNEAELRAWDQRVRDALPSTETVRYVCELKLDGLSLALHYAAGRNGSAAPRSAASPAATAPSAKTSPPTSAPSARVPLQHLRREVEGRGPARKLRGARRSRPPASRLREDERGARSRRAWPPP